MIMASQQTLSNANIEAWRKRIRDTTFANYHFQMGCALQRDGESAAAAAAYSRALAAQPDHACAALLLVRLMIAVGRADEAAAVDQAARRHDPAYDAWAVAELTLEALAADEREKAAQALALTIGGDLARTAAVRLASAAIAMQDGNVALAVENLTGVMASELESISRLPLGPLAVLAHRLMGAAELALAGTLLTALGRTVDDEPMLIFVRAILARSQGLLSTAEADLKALSVLGWSPTMVRLTYAATLLAMGRCDDADCLVTELLAAEPGHPSAIGIAALIRMGNGDDAAAEDVLGHDFATRNPTHAWPALAAIALLGRRGRHAEAEALTRSSIAALGSAFDLAVATFPLSTEVSNLARYAAAAKHQPLQKMEAS